MGSRGWGGDPGLKCAPPLPTCSLLVACAALPQFFCHCCCPPPRCCYCLHNRLRKPHSLLHSEGGQCTTSGSVMLDQDDVSISLLFSIFIWHTIIRMHFCLQFYDALWWGGLQEDVQCYFFFE